MSQKKFPTRLADQNVVQGAILRVCQGVKAGGEERVSGQ